MKLDLGSELRFLPTPPLFHATFRRFPSEYCHAVGFVKKIEWLGYLSDGEKILKIRLFVLTEFTNVTDRQTDRQTVRHRMTA